MGELDTKPAAENICIENGCGMNGKLELRPRDEFQPLNWSVLTIILLSDVRMHATR